MLARSAASLDIRSGGWLGAYKPRMLRHTGRSADGWLPSPPRLEQGQPAADDASAVQQRAAETAPAVRGLVEADRATGRTRDPVDRAARLPGRLCDALPSHLAYEERELLEPIAAHGVIL